jgi:DNA-binding beta-propeller fold protein YncE
VSALPARKECRSTAFVPNTTGGTVSTIDVKTRTKNPTDIPVGSGAVGLTFTPDGKTAFVTSGGMGTGNGRVSTIDVKARTKNPTDITVGPDPFGLAVTPDGKTVFVANFDSNTVSTIDVKTRDQEPHRHHRRLAPRLGGVHAGRQDCLRLQQRQRLGLDD